MTINELKQLLSRFNIKPNKLLGQNFLLSEKVLDEIVVAAELKNADTVVEIGPGLGALTQRLGDRAGLVLAVEKDRKIYAVLRKIFRNKKNVKIINDDALFVRVEGRGVRVELITSSHPYTLNPTPYKLIANIPYYITGKLLQNFLTAQTKPSLMVLLLQKEVAQRIVAKPGEMSILSVSTQFYSDPEIISYVSKDNFYPKPEVDSAVVRLRVLDKPRFAVDEKRFFQLVKIGFANKRKQLKNNLTSLPTSPHELGRGVSLPRRWGGIKGEVDYKEILESIGLNPLARAQDLSLDDWKRLFDRV